MVRPATRDRIVAAADDLFYRQGFEQTSFADVAHAVKISRGNFYYHFRTKDEILSAVIALRLAKTKEMLQSWEAADDLPADRIRSFIEILIRNKTDIMQHGCPVGTLCAELAKLDHVAQGDARGIFSLFRDWLRRQLELMGLRERAGDLALHILARSQGVAALANAVHDEAFIRREVNQMNKWLNTLSAERAPRTTSLNRRP